MGTQTFMSKGAGRAKPFGRVVLLATLAVVLSLFSVVHAGSAAELRVAPRWGTMWLSPRITGNWVMLEYNNPLPEDSKATGTVMLDLPAGITCLWASRIQFEQTPGLGCSRTFLKLPNVDLTQLRPFHHGHMLYMSTTLSPGTTHKCRVLLEYEGQKYPVGQFEIKVIDAPVASQPKKLMAGVALWPYQTSNWPDFAGQYSSLGFNHINFWHDIIHNPSQPSETVRNLVEQACAHNILTSIKISDTWDIDGVIKHDEDTQALFVNGSRGGRLGPCPSYRGPGFVDYIRNLLHVAESGISFIYSDEELYPNRNFHGACVCPRCESRWKEWLAVHRPDLEYRSGRDVIANYKDWPEYYRAWLWFKTALSTERYRILKEELVKAVEKYGANSSPSPMLGWWEGAAEYWSLEIGQHDGRGLGETIDFVAPQVYFRYKIPPRDFRKIVRRQAWAMDKRNSQIAIDSDDYWSKHANVPGNLAAAVLETIFAGNKGYCMWAGPYMDTRQWVELAEVNNLIARYEAVFLDGQETDLFRCYAIELTEGARDDIFAVWSDDVCTSTWENDDYGLLLISDYRKQRKPVWVERSRKYIGPMTLYDAFTDEKDALLTEGQWDFRIHVAEKPIRVLYWKKNTP